MLRRGGRDRRIRGLLFTDIVGSTDRAAALGDRRWRSLTAEHNRRVRSELRRHGGREMDTAGDGFFAAFDDPGGALDCAVAIARAVAPLGLAVRAGVHVGEVAPSEGKVGGIAVNTAARLLALAGPSEVIVSSTLRELVAGSDHVFEDRGTHELKGIPGEWRVYAVATGAEPASDAWAPAAATTGAARRRPRLRVVLVAVVVAVALVGTASALALTLARPRFTPRPDTIVALSPASGEVVGGASVGRGPRGVAVDGRAVWVASVDAGTVTRIGEDGSVASFGSAGDHPTQVAVHGGRAWVSDPYEGRLTILAADGQATPIRGVLARQISAGAAGVWIADEVRDRAVGLDPSSGRESAVVELPPGSAPTAVAVGPDAVWVASAPLRRVFRIDPATASVVDETSLADPPSALAWISGSLWVASRSADRVVRLGSDGSTQRLDVGDTPSAIAGDDRGVWISAAQARRVWQLATDGTVVRQIALDGVPAGIAVAPDRIWVALRSS